MGPGQKSHTTENIVKTFLLCLGSDWLKYFVAVHFLGWAAEHFEGDSNLAGTFFHNSVKDRWNQFHNK